jgi:hypothetical protein
MSTNICTCGQGALFRFPGSNSKVSPIRADNLIDSMANISCEPVQYCGGNGARSFSWVRLGFAHGRDSNTPCAFSRDSFASPVIFRPVFVGRDVCQAQKSAEAAAVDVPDGPGQRAFLKGSGRRAVRPAQHDC